MKNATLTTSTFLLSTIISLFLFLPSCNKWTYDEELNGIQFKKYKYSIGDNDTISIIGYIDSDMKINNIECAAGWIHLTPDMNLKLFCLAKPNQIKNVLLPKDTWIVSNYTYDNLTVVFPEDTLINEFPVKGGGGSKGAHTSFYDNGNLKSFFPFKKFEHNGIIYKKSIYKSVKLNENGEIIGQN